MKAPKVSEFAAFIGIDWADRKHDVCEVTAPDSAMRYSVISSKPEAIRDWALELRQRFEGRPVAVTCELKKGPLIYALSCYEHITIYPVNPSTVAKYRKAFIHSGAKNDPTDAHLQLEILLQHRDKLRPIQPECAEIRKLRQLTEYRRKLVQDRVDLTNRLTAALKNFFPQVLDWFKEKDTLVFSEFLQKWPSLNAAKRARKQSLLNFFNAHNSRYPSVNERRIQEIKSAVPLTEDLGVIEPNQILVEVLLPQVKALLSAIERLDKEIKHCYKLQPDSKIFDSLPGAGPQLAPRLLSAFGNDRKRFSDASEVQKFSGVAPVIEQSGTKSWTHWRYSCPKFLRQTFVEWAGQSIRFSFWAKAYYQQQISKGKPHNTAIRSLAFKWIRIAFKCWQTHTVYDESKYLEALKERGSPLLKFATNM